MWCIIIRQIVFQKDWFAVFKVKVVCCLQGQGHSYGSYTQNVAFKYIIWTADAFAIKLGLVAHHHKVDCLVKRLDCSVAVKVKVTEKVKKSSECSSGRYLLSCWTFCYQIWYGDATLWAKVSCKKIGLLSSSSRVTVRAHLIRYDCFYHMCWTADLFATRFNWMVHHHKTGVFCLKIRLLFSRWRSQWRFKTWLNLYVPIIFRTTLLLAAK